MVGTRVIFFCLFSLRVSSKVTRAKKEKEKEKEKRKTKKKIEKNTFYSVHVNFFYCTETVFNMKIREQ